MQPPISFLSVLRDESEVFLPTDLSIDEAVAEFKRQAAPLVAVSDRVALKKLYSHFVVYVRARVDKEDELAALSAMRQALRDAFREPSSKVQQRGWFDDL